MIHELNIPDVLRGRELRRIAWDDETGAVEGDHSQVLLLQQRIAEAPVTIRAVWGQLALQDPGRNASDFVALLDHECYCPNPRVLDHIPPSLADVAPTPWRSNSLPEGAVA